MLSLNMDYENCNVHEVKGGVYDTEEPQPREEVKPETVSSESKDNEEEKVFYQRVLKNPNGKPVLGVVGYVENGHYCYSAYPCFYAEGCDTNAILYYSLFSRVLPASSKDEAADMINDRFDKSEVMYNYGLGLNSIVWNNEFIGTIGRNQTCGRESVDVNICYGGKSSSFIAVIKGYLRSYEFNKANGIVNPSELNEGDIIERRDHNTTRYKVDFF